MKTIGRALELFAEKYVFDFGNGNSFLQIFLLSDYSFGEGEIMEFNRQDFLDELVSVEFRPLSLGAVVSITHSFNRIFVPLTFRNFGRNLRFTNLSFDGDRKFLLSFFSCVIDTRGRVDFPALQLYRGSLATGGAGSCSFFEIDLYGVDSFRTFPATNEPVFDNLIFRRRINALNCQSVDVSFKYQTDPFEYLKGNFLNCGFVSLNAQIDAESMVPLVGEIFSVKNCSELVAGNFIFEGTQLKRRIIDASNVGQVRGSFTHKALAGQITVDGVPYRFKDTTIGSTFDPRNDFFRMEADAESVQPVFIPSLASSDGTFIRLENGSSYTNGSDRAKIKAELYDSPDPIFIDKTSTFLGELGNQIADREIFRSQLLPYLNGASSSFTHNWADFDPATDWHQVQAWAVCQIAQAGWQLGERVLLNGRRATASVDATQISVQVGANGIQVGRKDGNLNDFNLSPNNWLIYVEAERI